MAPPLHLVRPHEALGQQLPVSRYQCSARTFPKQLPDVESPADDHVLKVRSKGQIHLKGKIVLIGESLAGQQVATGPSSTDGMFDVYFCQKHIT